MKTLLGFFTKPVSRGARRFLIALFCISAAAVFFTLETFRARTPAYSDAEGMPWLYLAYLLISFFVFIAVALKVSFSHQR
jgi:hypothetical protein